MKKLSRERLFLCARGMSIVSAFWPVSLIYAHIQMLVYAGVNPGEPVPPRSFFAWTL